VKEQLVFPLAFYVAYMFGIAVLNFRTRFHAIRTGVVPGKYFKTFQGEAPPEHIVRIGRHYDNQFQLPFLFFIAALVDMNLGQTSITSVVLAWLFVLTRVCHSWIHLGANKLPKRAFFFALGWFVVVITWARLAYLAL
jgi:hypothetical protein